VRALVTGGAGLIGSHLVDDLLAVGADVVVLDNLASGRVDNVAAGAELVEGDIDDRPLLDKVIGGCDVVFHQAASRSVPRSVEQPVETDRVNVAGTLNVLTASRDAGVRRVVLASSSSIYGGADQLPTPESTPLTPRSPYAVSKLAGEHYARVFWELYGLETVSLRYFNVFGPRQDPASRYAAVIPRFIAALFAGEQPEVHGDGRQTRDFTHVADAARANRLAATAPADACAGRAYNVARGAPATLLDVLAVLASEIGVTVEPRHVEARRGDIRHSHADIGAARDDLGWEPEVTLEEGLARTVAWYQKTHVADGRSA
jgi:UDP-N-acetylglucosamine/UDP-N-acetyl-alpha-D-glucosaminouronate 4-epimerase